MACPVHLHGYYGAEWTIQFPAAAAEVAGPYYEGFVQGGLVRL